MPQRTQEDFWKTTPETRELIGKLVAKKEQANSDLEDALQEAIKTDGATFTELGLILGRSEGAIRAMAQRRGWSMPGARRS